MGKRRLQDKEIRKYIYWIALETLKELFVGKVDRGAYRIIPRITVVTAICSHFSRLKNQSFSLSNFHFHRFWNWWVNSQTVEKTAVRNCFDTIRAPHALPRLISAPQCLRDVWGRRGPPEQACCPALSSFCARRLRSLDDGGGSREHSAHSSPLSKYTPLYYYIRFTRSAIFLLPRLSFILNPNQWLP